MDTRINFEDIGPLFGIVTALEFGSNVNVKFFLVEFWNELNLINLDKSFFTVVELEITFSASSYIVCTVLHVSDHF